MKCPKCSTELREQDIIQIKGSNEKVIGINFFCPNQSCNYETDKRKV